MSLGTTANTGLIVAGCVFLFPTYGLPTCPPGTDSIAFCLNLHILSVARLRQSRRDIRLGLHSSSSFFFGGGYIAMSSVE